MPKKPDLDHNAMLLAEFKYITESAFQANEDRSRVTSFYFVSVGSLVASIIGVKFGETQREIYLAFGVLFLALTIIGGLTIAQLARLRAAWHEAAQAMNKIKDYYIKHNPDMAVAFKWRVKSIPPTDKPYSIANLIAVEVALLGGLTASASAYFLLLFFGIGDLTAWLIVGACLLFGYIAQIRWYKWLLVDDR